MSNQLNTEQTLQQSLDYASKQMSKFDGAVITSDMIRDAIALAYVDGMIQSAITYKNIFAGVLSGRISTNQDDF